MRIVATPMKAQDLRPGDLFTTEDRDWDGLVAASRSEPLQMVSVYVRLNAPFVGFRQRAEVFRLTVEEGDDEASGPLPSERPPTLPGEGARRKYWAIHSSSNYPPHDGNDQALSARKAINYRTWETILGHPVSSGAALTPEDWGALATYIDRLYQGEYDEPEEWRRWREGTHPVFLGLFHVEEVHGG